VEISRLPISKSMLKSDSQHQGTKATIGSAGSAGALSRLQEEFVKQLRFSTRLAAPTLRGYQQVFALLNQTMPNLGAQQFSPEAMTEFFRRLDARPRFVRGRESRGVKASTVATYRSKLNRFCDWLKARGEIEMNPFSAMPYPRVEYEDRKYLERSQVERVLATVALGTLWRDRLVRRRNAALFAVLLYTGVRKGELLGLRVMDLDLNRLELTVRAETSKSRMRRVVPINATLCVALEDYFGERQRRGFQCEYVFTSGQADRPFTAEGLKHLVNQVRRLSGVQFHLHQFRHTFAVNLLNRGGDIAKLKQLLGHRDIRMTSSYLRCLPTSAMRTSVENITLDTLL
jgi:site-specific recombinase XerD